MRRARSFVTALACGVAAIASFDCAGILGIEPTVVDDTLGEGGNGGDQQVTGFQAPTVDAPTVTFDPSCIKSVRAIYRDDNFAPDTITADDKGIFWSGNYDSETGYMRALTAEGLTTIVDHDYAVQGTAVDRDHVYFSTMNDYNGAQGPGVVRAWDRGSDHGVTTLGFGTAPPGVGGIVVEGANLFFGSYTYLDDAGAGIFKATAPFNESTAAVAVVPALSPFHLAVDSQTIYFDEAPAGFLGIADGYKFSQISKVPRAGGGASVIDNDTVVADIEVANGVMYWATDYVGTIRSYDGQQAKDYADVPGVVDLQPDVAHNELYALSVPNLDGSEIVRLPLGKANATPKNCIGPIANTYSIAYYGHHLYFGSKSDQGPSVLYDAEVNP